MKFNIVGSPYNKELKDVTLGNGVRYYYTPEGKKYPSVTTVLELCTRDKIQKWREKVGEKEANFQSKRASGRGTKLHGLLERYLKGEQSSNLVFEYPMGIVSLFQGMKPIMDLHLNNIHLQEASLYTDTFKVAGRVDCIAEWDQELAVIDFKGSNHEKNEAWITNYFMQTSAYAFMYWQHTGMLPTKIVIVMGSETGGPQVFVKNPKDYIKLFQEAVQRYYQENN